MTTEKIPTVRFVEIDVGQTIVATVRAVSRLLYTVAIFGGCTYLVFWRFESGWLYLLALVLLWFRRGL